MRFEWKLPRITADPMIYGKYLTLHPDMMPQQGISLETAGYFIKDVDYGSAEENQLPFKKGDWVEEDYVKNNFREVM